MRELNKQDMIDLLYGCAVLGTGGGGPLADGLALLEEHFEKGKTLKLITLDELPDDEYVVTPVSYTHLDVYKRQNVCNPIEYNCAPSS